MWLFLATEILLFGGLFCAYAVYRSNHPEVFVYAHTFLDKYLGAINTVILLCSSLTMAWGVRAAQLGQRKLLVTLLSLTLLGGAGFMSIKYVEYKAKWEHGLLWARSYHPESHEEAHGEEPATQAAASRDDAADPAAGGEPSPVPAQESAPAQTNPASAGLVLERTTLPPPADGPRGPAGSVQDDRGHAIPVEPANVQVFFSIYFLMTGLHGLHVLAGMGAIGWVLRKAMRGMFGPAYFTPVDLVGLYWHLVDLIWIFLFPLLYLIH
jgi:cytochrome c oxidase subunit 3